MLRRHAKSFVKGATGTSPGKVPGGTAAQISAASAQPVATPTEVLDKAKRMIRRVMALQVVWFAMCAAGGLTIVISLFRGSSAAYGVLLLFVGIVGIVVTGYVTTRLAAKYLGAGATAFLRSQSRAGRRYGATDGGPPGPGSSDGRGDRGGPPGMLPPGGTAS